MSALASGVGATALTIAHLPQPGSRTAPEKFKGDYMKVRTFVKQYERLLALCNVTNDRDKCENITQYCGSKTNRLIEVLKAYQEGNWPALKNQILKLFDADRDLKRYKIRDLDDFVRHRKSIPIKTLSDWTKFIKDFIAIAGWLQLRNKISDDDYSVYLWQGIHRKLRQKIEDRLLVGDVTRDMSTPFESDKIILAAEKLLQRDRFDTDRAWSDSEDDSDDDSSSSSDSSSSDSSESEDDSYRRKKKSRKSTHSSKKKQTKKKSKRVESDGEQTSRDSKKVSIDDLVHRMSRLSLDDPKYALLYLQALRQNPDIKLVLARPIHRDAKQKGSTQSGTSQGHEQQSTRDTRPQQTPSSSSNNTYPRTNPRPPFDHGCFGCGSNQHGLGSCPEIQDLVSSGKLRRNDYGKVIMPDGTRLFRIGNENLVQSYHRLSMQEPSTAKSNFVVVQEEHQSKWTDSTDDDYQSDDESDDEGPVWVYPAFRSIKSTAEGKRKVLDGVYPPPRSWKKDDSKDKPARQYEILKKKDKEVPQEAAKSANKSVERPNETPKTQPAKNVPEEKQGRQDSCPKPHDTREPEYNGDDSDAIMEDIEDTGKGHKDPKLHAKSEKNKREFTANTDRAIGIRRSELSGEISPKEVISKILNTPIQLTAGEILGSSKELSNLLTEKVKIRAPHREAQVHHLGPHGKPPLGRALSGLIRATVIIKGLHVTAIIDTGSQASIIHRRIWNQISGISMDLSRKLVLHDANNGQSTLVGVAEDVPIILGSVPTTAALWLGEHCPFDLLLGRPWQQDNYVTIEERLDGTYLVIGNHELKIDRDPGPAGDNRGSGNVMFQSQVTQNFGKCLTALGTVAEISGITATPQDKFTTRASESLDECLKILNSINVNLDQLSAINRENYKNTDIDTGKFSEITPVIQMYNTLFQPITYQPYDSPRVTQGPSTQLVRSHDATGNEHADYLVLNAVQFGYLRNEVRANDGHFILYQVIETPLTPSRGNPTPNSACLPVCPLPDVAWQIKSPTPLAFTARATSGPFLPSLLPSPPSHPSSNTVHPSSPPPEGRTSVLLQGASPVLKSSTVDPRILSHQIIKSPKLSTILSDELSDFALTNLPSILSDPTDQLGGKHVLATELLGASALAFVYNELANNAPPSPQVALGHDDFDLVISSRSPSPSIMSDVSSFWDLPRLPTSPPPSLMTTPALTPDSSRSNSPRLFYPSPPLTPDSIHVPPYHGLSREIFGDDVELTQAPARFGLLYYHNDAFDGRRALLTPPMQPSPFSAPHSLSYSEPPLPFTGTYKYANVKHALACAETIDEELEALNYCDLGACIAVDQLLKRPPSIYYCQEDSYALHVPRGHIPFKTLYPDYRRIRRLHTDLLQATHAVLTPQQSLECQQETIYAILVEGTLNTPVRLIRSAFYQQCAPAANPFFTNNEIAYLRTAVGFLRFYFETSLANAIDLVLQRTVADEDVVHSLLLDFHLDNLAGTCRTPAGRLESVLAIAEQFRHLQIEEQRRHHAAVGLIKMHETPNEELGRC
jgi:hypothetical protein